MTATATVDEYLAEIERMQSLDLDVATEFLLIASTLVELKARRLLPGRELARVGLFAQRELPAHLRQLR